MRFLTSGLALCVLAATVAASASPRSPSPSSLDAAVHIDVGTCKTPDTAAVIHQYLDTLRKRDFPALVALGAPNATFFFAGLQSKIPYAGTLSFQDRITQQMPTLFGPFKTFDVQELGLTVQGDTGVLEITVRGVGPDPDNKLYENNSLMKFKVTKGKVASIREYMDFFEVFAYLGIDA